MFLVKKDFFKNTLRLSGIEGSISNVDLGLFQPNNQLKAHSQVWDNFWKLKALLKWWKMFFFHLKNSSSYGNI